MVYSVTEMYDLCTVKDKIGVIGIHTPGMGLISRSWKGMLDNHKYIKLLSCTVKIACASHLPVDPLQVGTDANTQVSPQDMMNPILYRACTNEGWNVIMNRVYGNGSDRSSLRYFADAFTSVNASTQDQMYYALLASNEWRKAMPQIGLEMTGLKPFVYTVVNTYGNLGKESSLTPADTTLNSVLASNASGVPQAPATTNTPITFRGHAIPYPAILCTGAYSPTTAEGADEPQLINGTIPKSYVACILMPPSKSRIMYYRLVISWYFEFLKPVPLYEKYDATNLAWVGGYAHAITYNDPAPSGSKEIAEADNSVIDGDLKEGGTLDTVDAPLTLVLQK